MVLPTNPNHCKEKRALLLGESFFNDEAAQIAEIITYLNILNDKEPITLYIASRGGGRSAAFSIYDVIKQSKAPVHGIVLTQAISFAILVLEACAKRFMLPHATLFMHGIMLTYPLDEVLADNFKNVLDDSKEEQEFMAKVYAERSGKDIEEFRKIFRNGRNGKTFTAEYAKEFGLIDEILYDTDVDFYLRKFSTEMVMQVISGLDE